MGKESGEGVPRPGPPQLLGWPRLHHGAQHEAPHCRQSGSEATAGDTDKQHSGITEASGAAPAVPVYAGTASATCMWFYCSRGRRSGRGIHDTTVHGAPRLGGVGLFPAAEEVAEGIHLRGVALAPDV